jgi:lycopene beta-cyclase
MALWPRSNRLQRDFAVFGGEFLGAQPVSILRGFFDAFFALETAVCGGFLAGWPGLPGNEYHASYLARLTFGVQIFFKFPPRVALTFVGYLVSFTLEYGPLIMRSIFTPVFELGAGAPSEASLASRRQEARSRYVAGDVAAKQEAVEMLRAGRGEPSPQVALLVEDAATTQG